jgi:hypothetical protein
MAHSRLSRLLPFALLACTSGSDDGGSGGSGGGSGDFQAKAAAVCDRQVADGCAESSFCEDRLISDYERNVAFGCTSELEAYADCLATHTWKCEPLSGGGQQVFEPVECSDLEAAFDACEPQCSWSIVGDTQCDMSCPWNGQDIGVDCPTGPGSCTCSIGPKAGTAVQIQGCGHGELAQAIVASCS